MEIIKVFLELGFFVGVIALIMTLLEKLAKKVGSKVIYISIIFVIPFIIGVAVVVSSYQSLVWYEIVYIPFLGSALILATTLAILVSLNPANICLPFQYAWKKFVKKRK